MINHDGTYFQEVSSDEKVEDSGSEWGGSGDGGHGGVQGSEGEEGPPEVGRCRITASELVLHCP